MDRMEIDFTFTGEDWLAFQAFVADKLPNDPGSLLKRWLLILWMFVLAGLGVFSLVDCIQKGNTSASELFPRIGMVVFFSGATLVAAAPKFCFEALFRLLLRQSSRRQDGPWSQPWQVALSPEGLTVVTANQFITTRWKAIQRIAETPDLIVFLSGKKEGFAVPRRAFRDEIHFHCFVDLARRYQAAASPADVVKA